MDKSDTTTSSKLVFFFKRRRTLADFLRALKQDCKTNHELFANLRQTRLQSSEGLSKSRRTLADFLRALKQDFKTNHDL